MSKSAGYIFDPELLMPILKEIIDKIPRQPRDPRLEKMPGVIRAVDESFLRCLPKMVWAVFRKQSVNRGVRLRLQFQIDRSIPVSADITSAHSSKTK